MPVSKKRKKISRMRRNPQSKAAQIASALEQNPRFVELADMYHELSEVENRLEAEKKENLDDR